MKMPRRFPLEKVNEWEGQDHLWWQLENECRQMCALIALAQGGSSAQPSARVRRWCSTPAAPGGGKWPGHHISDLTQHPSPGMG